MKLRLLPAVLATTVAASTLFIAGPAMATPTAPGIGALDTSTPGKVSGSVTSDQPFVFVGLAAGVVPVIRTKVTMADGGAFELETWGFGPGTTLDAWACPTDTYDVDGCSPVATQAFTPTDLVPGVTWFTDDHIGPNDPQPSITVTDPGGGGLIQARQENGFGVVYSAHVVSPGTPENIPVADDLNGFIRLYRCNADASHCTKFTPDQTHALAVVQHLTVQVPEPINPVNATTDSSFRLHITDSHGVPITGTATVTWHLVHQNGGAPEGSEHVIPAAATDGSGNTAPATISGAGIPDDDYDVVGTIDLDNADFGTFSDVQFNPSGVRIDVHAAVLTVTASYPTIYPNIGTTTRPNKQYWVITGADPDFADIGRAEIQTSGGTLIKQVGVYVGSSASSVQWDGRDAGSQVVPAGSYKLVLWDQAGNPIAAGAVTVDTRHLVTKTWKHTFSAASTLVDKYVGKCSTLRKPALRGWYNSLGFYSNTKCDSRSSAYSLVSTVHGIYLPKVSDGYVSVGVDVYGGAARSRPGSQGVLRYLSVAGNWTSGQFLTSRLGTHTGQRRAAKGMVDTDRSFLWGFYTAYGHRYDVKSFTVVVTYKALG